MDFKKLEVKVSGDVAKALHKKKEPPPRYQCKVCYKMKEGKPFGFRYFSSRRNLRKESLWTIVHPNPICSSKCHAYLVDHGYTLFDPPVEMRTTISLKIFLDYQGKSKSFELTYFKILTTPAELNANVIHRYLSYKYGYHYKDTLFPSKPEDHSMDSIHAMTFPTTPRLGDYLKAHPEFEAAFNLPPILHCRCCNARDSAYPKDVFCPPINGKRIPICHKCFDQKVGFCPQCRQNYWFPAPLPNSPLCSKCLPTSPPQGV